MLRFKRESQAKGTLSNLIFSIGFQILKTNGSKNVQNVIQMALKKLVCFKYYKKFPIITQSLRRLGAPPPTPSVIRFVLH